MLSDNYALFDLGYFRAKCNIIIVYRVTSERFQWLKSWRVPSFSRLLGSKKSFSVDILRAEFLAVLKYWNNKTYNLYKKKKTHTHLLNIDMC